MKIGAMVPDMVPDYVFWSQVAQRLFLGHRPQSQAILWDFIISIDSSYDFRKNEVLFLKIRARVLELWLDTSSGPKWPKCSGPRTPKSSNLLRLNDVIRFIWWFWRKWGPFVKIGARVLDIRLDTSSGPK